MDIFVQFLSKNTQIFDEKLLKMIKVCPDCAPWRSDQEWRSICADTVGISVAMSLPLQALLTVNESFQMK